MTETLTVFQGSLGGIQPMQRKIQFTFTGFEALKKEFFEAVESLDGHAANHNGTAIRPGPLMEYFCAKFVLADPRARVEMARRAEEAHAAWLKGRAVKDGVGKPTEKTTSGVAMVPATGKPEVKKGKRRA